MWTCLGKGKAESARAGNAQGEVAFDCEKLDGAIPPRNGECVRHGDREVLRSSCWMSNSACEYTRMKRNIDVALPKQNPRSAPQILAESLRGEVESTAFVASVSQPHAV